MAFYGIFRVDPPPVQPAPHVPIPAQGQQPPASGNQRDTDTLFGANLWPPLDWPAQRRPIVSSPAIVYGQQPPPIANQRNPEILFGSNLWPPLDWGAQSRPIVVSPAFVYGSQPPPLGGERDPEILFGAFFRFQSLDWPAQRSPQIVVATFVRTDFPPTRGPIPTAALFGSGLWPPLDWPAQTPPKIVPLTLTYGQQPPPLGGQRDPDVLFGMGLWPQPDWPAQGPPRIASFVLSVFAQPAYVPTSISLAVRSWNPPDPQPTQRDRRIAGLTLVYGQQPPTLGNLRDPDVLFGSGLWPPLDWAAQRSRTVRLEAPPTFAQCVQTVVARLPSFSVEMDVAGDGLLLLTCDTYLLVDKKTGLLLESTDLAGDMVCMKLPVNQIIMKCPNE